MSLIGCLPGFVAHNRLIGYVPKLFVLSGVIFRKRPVLGKVSDRSDQECDAKGPGRQRLLSGAGKVCPNVRDEARCSPSGLGSSVDVQGFVEPVLRKRRVRSIVRISAASSNPWRRCASISSRPAGSTTRTGPRSESDPVFECRYEVFLSFARCRRGEDAVT